MILCLDTSHGASAALLQGGQVRARGANDNPRQHTEALTPLITGVLDDAGAVMAEVSGVVVGTGPAPFTGLRVGLITARALGFALAVPVYGVAAVAGIARGVFDREGLAEVTILTDARRKEVYWARYAPAGADDVVELSPPAVARPADIRSCLTGRALRGLGVELYPEDFEGSAAGIDPAALGRIALARLQAAREAGVEADLPTEPLYLRRPDIHQGQGRKRAS